MEPIALIRTTRWVVLLLMLSGLWACSGAARWETEESQPVRTPSTQAPVKRVPAEPQNVVPRKTVSGLLNEYYANWRGTPYRFGGTSRRGIDCSAFTQQAMSDALGVSLPRTTRDQLKRGRSIASHQVRPGDLVFFQTGETLKHVGVMIGPGKFMHASTSKGVTISRTDDSYWGRRVIDYRRVLN